MPENVAAVGVAPKLLLPDVSERVALSVVPLAAYASTFANPVAVSDSPVPTNVAVVGVAVKVLLPDTSLFKVGRVGRTARRVGRGSPSTKTPAGRLRTVPFPGEGRRRRCFVVNVLLPDTSFSVSLYPSFRSRRACDLSPSRSHFSGLLIEARAVRT